MAATRRGHVRQRGKTWCAVISIGRGEDGRYRYRWYSGFPTKKAAEVKLTELLGQKDTGNYIEPTKLTVAKYLRQWLETLSGSEIRPSTLSAYATFCDVHLIPALGHRKLQELTVMDLNRFLVEMAAHGRKRGLGKGGPLSPRTVHYAHSTIRKAMQDAVDSGLLLRNVAASNAIKLPKAVNREMQVWSGPQLKEFLDFVHDDRLVAAYTVLGTIGLRRGELLGLRWKDVDLEAGRMAVLQTVIEVDGKRIFSTPKTRAGRRVLAPGAGSIDALRQHRTRQLEERMALGLGRPGPDDLVFANADGTAIGPGLFSDRFDRLVKASGLPRIRVHDLRHTAATLGLSAGIQPKVMSERLGHSNIAMTLDLYSHVLPAQQVEAADRIDAQVFGA